MMQTLKVISIQSQNAAESCRQISHYLAGQLGIDVQFINDVPWQERDKMFNEGEADIGWICGLPYVKKAADYPGRFELIGAPVMQHARYQHRPVYYSDVVVRRDSRFQSFGDLRGTRWAFNEPNSQSGYNITRYHLAQLGETNCYFNRVLEAGSHLNAIDLVLDGEIEAAAIDSTVLELAYEDQPQLKDNLRVIEVLGPSPIPPWVINRNVPALLRNTIRQVFWHMHTTVAGRQILADGQIEQIAPVSDADYDLIREMAQAAETVRW
ncbi:MAG: phosphate/phosphite/phosphonate ABC transporter substrate-binding protein [Anaerolineae bacterium]